MDNTDSVDKALALHYDPELPAPLIIAKGRGWQARMLQKEAQKVGIPVIRDSELTDALIGLRTDTFIPESCYEVVAAIYRFVYHNRTDLLRKRHEEFSDK